LERITICREAPPAATAEGVLRRAGGRGRTALLGLAGLFSLLLFSISLLMAGATPVSASPANEDGSLKCHACHENPNFEVLRLADGTRLSLDDSAPLCAQCHVSRFEAWTSGTHGFPGFVAGSPAGNPPGSTSCTSCHDPHKPRIVLTDIAKPHPGPVAPPPAIPQDFIIIAGITLGVIGIGFAFAVLNGRSRR
jgi:hypothetical protein